MRHWIQAARVRTLPLSVSGILVGSFYAMSQAMFNWKIVIFAILTTLGLQILSNFANGGCTYLDIEYVNFDFPADVNLAS